MKKFGAGAEYKLTLKMSYKSENKFLSYPANKGTNRRINKQNDRTILRLCQNNKTYCRHLCSGLVLCIFLLAGRRKEQNVINGLNKLQLNDALYQQRCKQLVIRSHFCTTEHNMLGSRYDTRVFNVVSLV